MNKSMGNTFTLVFIVLSFLLNACGADVSPVKMAYDMKIGSPAAVSVTGAGAQTAAAEITTASTTGKTDAEKTFSYISIKQFAKSADRIHDAAGNENTYNGAYQFTSAGNENTYNNGAYQFMPAELDAMKRKKTGWGVKLDGHNQPVILSSERDLFDKYNAAFAGNADDPVIYLTFDLGYENGYTVQILDTLKDKGVKASFFITGYYLSSQPDIIGRIIAEDHIPANHSQNHKCFPELSDDGVIAEIKNFEDGFKNATGSEPGKYVRPPSGEYSERSLAVTASLGYKSIFWSFAYVDYDEKKPPSDEYAYKKITDNLHNGAIILLHTVNKANASVLGRVIDRALEDGYTFSTIDKL